MEASKVCGIEVPLAALQPETVMRVIQEFVLREGTDYGMGEYSLDEKVAQVRRQIERGKARILYDEKSDTCTIEVVK